MYIEVTNLPELSIGEPQSVPSRISVVLVEEAKAGGTPRLGCPRVDQDLRLLAGVAKPASVTVCENSDGSPCVGGTLSSSDLAGRLLPVVTAGIPFAVGPVDHTGPMLQVALLARMGHCPHLTLNLLALLARMLQVALLARMGHCPRLFLTLLAWMARMLQVALLALMGHCPRPTLNLLALLARMLQVALLARMGHCPHPTLNLLALLARMLQVALLARMGRCPRLFLTLLAQMARMLQVALLARMGHCPRLSLNLLALSARMLQVAPLARMGRCPRLFLTLLGRMARMLQVALLAHFGTLSPSDSGSAILVDPGGVFPFSDPPPGGTLLPGEEGPGLRPSVPTDDLVSVAAVPLPAVRDPIIALSPVEGLVRECDDVTEESITVHDGWSDPEVSGTPAVVAMVGMDALPMRNDAPLDCVDGGTAWIADNGYRCETIDGMTVYYGSDLCALDESDWDDPYDIASEEYVDQYNFDVPEGMDQMVFERGRGPYGSDMLDDEGTGLTHVCQTTLSDPQGELDTVDIDPLANIFNGTLSGTADAGSPTVRSGGGIYDYQTILDEEGDILSKSQTVLAYQPHSVLNASDFVESETSNAFDLRSPEDLFTDTPDDLL